MTTAAVRLEQDQVEELDAIAERLSKRADGVPVSRSHVLRQVIAKGIQTYTRELDRDDAKRAK
jgi:hypothetical protein